MNIHNLLTTGRELDGPHRLICWQVREIRVGVREVYDLNFDYALDCIAKNKNYKNWNYVKYD